MCFTHPYSIDLKKKIIQECVLFLLIINSVVVDITVECSNFCYDNNTHVIIAVWYIQMSQLHFLIISNNKS